ncbi:MAG TPA: glycogen-binding domain-containing protein [bacterium]|nr:glycogen-binding domain-containing protein [bacterium]
MPAKKPTSKSKTAAKPARPAAKKTTRKTTKPATDQVRPVTFVLDAPYGRDVALAGTFNNWTPQSMARDADGLWRLRLDLAPGLYRYKFLIDSEWKEDPANERKEPNEFGGYNSVIEVT